jgi:outer membrane protein assembly factor BamB
MRRAMFFVLLAATLALAPGASAAGWLRFGGDAQVTDDVPLADAPDGFGVTNAGALQARWRTTLDATVVASPLYVGGTAPRAGVLYLATEAGSVYALRADDGALIWQRTLPTTTIDGDEDCGTYGVSSTGAVDEARGVLYVAAADGTVHALDLATGAEAKGWPLTLPIDTTTAYVWGALTLDGSDLYVPVSSYCDTPNPVTGAFADGGLIRVDVAQPAATARFEVSGPGTLGGIWGYGGASLDPLTGDIWVATGNSEPLGDGETKGYAESVVELDPSLHVVAWNRPTGIPDDNLDTDFGSTPLLFQPEGCPPLAAAHNKNGNLYVWRRDELGDGPVWTMKTGPDDVANPFVGEPSWSGDLQTLVVANARLYDATGAVERYDAAVGFKIGPGCAFPAAPTWAADAGTSTKPPALLVGDLAFVAGGASRAFTILDASDGTVLLTLSLSEPQLAAPILAGNEVVVADTAGNVYAIGSPAPAAPAGLLHVRRALQLG